MSRAPRVGGGDPACLPTAVQQGGLYSISYSRWFWPGGPPRSTSRWSVFLSWLLYNSCSCGLYAWLTTWLLQYVNLGKLLCSLSLDFYTCKWGIISCDVVRTTRIAQQNIQSGAWQRCSRDAISLLLPGIPHWLVSQKLLATTGSQERKLTARSPRAYLGSCAGAACFF